MQEPYRKGSSESILTSSLAGNIVRCFLKRRQRHRWAGRLSCEKPVDLDADCTSNCQPQANNCILSESIRTSRESICSICFACRCGRTFLCLPTTLNDK